MVQANYSKIGKHYFGSESLFPKITLVGKQHCSRESHAFRNDTHVNGNQENGAHVAENNSPILENDTPNRGK